MKNIFILLFVFVALLSIMFITGCNDSSRVSKISKVVRKLAPMGEKTASSYLDKLVTNGKITEYQKEKIVKIYLKLKAKVKKDKADKTKESAADKPIKKPEKNVPAAAIPKTDKNTPKDLSINTLWNKTAREGARLKYCFMTSQKGPIADANIKV